MKRTQRHYLTGRLEKLHTIDREISLLKVSSFNDSIIIAINWHSYHRFLWNEHTLHKGNLTGKFDWEIWMENLTGKFDWEIWVGLRFLWNVSNNSTINNTTTNIKYQTRTWMMVYMNKHETMMIILKCYFWKWSIGR